MRHFIEPNSFSLNEQLALLDLADRMEKDPAPYAHLCDGRILATLFYEPFTEISTRELENTLKGKAVHYIVNDAGEGLCLFFEGWTDNTGSNHGDAIHISPVIDAAGKPQLVVQYVPEEERPEDSETCNNGVVGE